MRPSPPLAVLLTALVACGPEPEPEPYDCAASGAVCTVMGDGTHGDNGDGNKATKTWLYYPAVVRFFDDGSPLVVDQNAFRLRSIDDQGKAFTVVGSGFHSAAIDGIQATESPLENPIDAQILADGSIVIAEYHMGRILHVDPTGWLTVLGGTGFLGYSGDDGPAREATFSEAAGLAVGDDGTIYVADTDNHCIRAIDPATGLVSPVAGDGVPGPEDGPVSEAHFHQPWHMVWHDDALFIADRANHRIRRLDLVDGTVSTVAGTGEAGHSGDGGPATEARLNDPTGLDVAPDGTLWIADRLNHVLRRVAPDGTIQTVLGSPGQPGDGPDEGDASELFLTGPESVSVGPEGRLWIVDTQNSKVRVYVP